MSMQMPVGQSLKSVDELETSSASSLHVSATGSDLPGRPSVSSSSSDHTSTVLFPHHNRHSMADTSTHRHSSSLKVSPGLNSRHVRMSVRSTTSVDTSTSLNTEYNGPIIPPPTDARFKRRTIILCFDGTGDEFDQNNSNVVQFCSVLKKGDRKRQLVYYQSGLGTYTIPQVATPLYTMASKTLDLMFAKNLNFHVMSGYRFLMENYKEGDKICIFGFSRGAYTARALAGMIHKVGLLPAGNEQQVPFAYKMYMKDNEKGWKQSVLFKKTFSIDVDIEFVGVWDTVASVGLFPRFLPFTRSNTAIKTFRHALSLDEHRVKFMPSLHEKLDAEAAQKYDFITPPSSASRSPNAKSRPTARAVQKSGKSNFFTRSAKEVSDTLVQQRNEVASALENTFRSRSDEELSPDSERDRLEQLYLDRSTQTDTLEVWFAGCHCDIGGGSVDNGTPHSLARVPLRWMIRECFKANTGIQFEADKLYELGLDPHGLYPKVMPRSCPTPMVNEKPLPDAPIPTTVSSPMADCDEKRANHMSIDGTLVGHSREVSMAESERSVDGVAVLERKTTTVVDETKTLARDDRDGSPKRHERKSSTWQAAAEDEEDKHDALTPVYDQLKLKKYWWILEYLPIRERIRQPDGSWKKKWILHRGKPRIVPQGEPVKVHRTVKMRMESKDIKYKPRAVWSKEPEWVD